MYGPMNSGMIAIPPIVPVAPVVYSPNNINMYVPKEYDSYTYGKFRHIDRDYPQYRHVPFDWYQPPSEPYNIVHEDTAIITHDGPISIDEFYRCYIYGRYTDDSCSDSDSSSTETDFGYGYDY